MIQFLKESTFAVNEVFAKSFFLLRHRYFAIAGLCFLLFFTSNLISLFYLSDYSALHRLFLVVLFGVVYLGLQLTLMKYLLSYIGSEGAASVRRSIPSTRELLYFFLSMLLILLVVAFCYAIISLAGWPFIYLGVKIEVMVGISVGLSALLMFVFLLRAAFYPYFIIDQGGTPWRAIRLSIALTRGNVTKLLLILLFFAILHFLNGYVSYHGLLVLSIMLNVVSSFFIVPLSSVVVAVAYRTMMDRYNATGAEAQKPAI